ncbi:MAG: hypothetical protein FGM40_02665 [Rhodocyclaceae bacterium]|nr:hypothetical protein [Rhodocyclaceae bacterium]
MRDFRNNKKKNLDLVICPAGGAAAGRGGSRGGSAKALTFDELVPQYGIRLSAEEHAALLKLPQFPIAGVGNVLLALEAKAAMTAHQKARPRLKDELTSSFQTIHGDNERAIAAGLVMVNAADNFISPDMNKHPLGSADEKLNIHKQPRDAQQVISSLRDLQRRSRVDDVGFDAIGVISVECKNNGEPVKVVASGEAAPIPEDDFHYARFVDRIAHLYSTRFQLL